MPLTQSDTYQITWLVRRLFFALSQKSDERLAEAGITGAGRAVMEFLYPDEALSVPEMAKRYQVSRQHIQVTVNGLLELGLVVTRDNPRHKRSFLIALNRKGRNLFAEILAEDKRQIEELFADIPGPDVQATRRTLEALYARLGAGERMIS